MIKLSDYVMKYVADMGVKDLFMLSGGGCMHLVDSVGRNPDLNYVCCLHEQVASFAATAYAQYTNNIGVALVTTGPGSTNAITGVAAAWTDSIPTLILSGQVKRPDICKGTGLRTFGFQEIDIVSIVKPITKYAVTVIEPKEIKYHLDKACYLARTGRPGPVWLDIPLDVQASMIDEDKLSSFKADKNEPENNLTGKVLKIIEMVNKSERPVIIAGYGIKVTESEKEFIELVKKLNIPVLTTWKALDLLPEDFNLYFGRPGCIGQRGANFIQQNSDLIISIGARLDYGQIGFSHETFAREAKKVVIDVDAAELKKFKFKLDEGINASADKFLKEFLEQSDKVEKVDRNPWLKRCAEWKNRYPVVLPQHWDKKDYVSTYALVDELSNISKENDLFVPENSGAASEIVMQALKIKSGQRVIATNSLGSMGSGLPASIGACVASGKKNTISVIGDGGLQMNIQDLETVARLKLPIKYFILNNDGYGSIRNTQRNYFNGLYVASDPSSGVTTPDLKKIADAYEIKYALILNNSEIKEQVKASLSSDGPVICEVMVDPEEPTMPKLKSQVKPDGSMVSKPLEDLWPFLDREEFKDNMIVEPIEE
ncbi:MAG: thiamine pyrophosphate-binding protein [Candidatus Margulisiibacteriota bacterium]|nr:thiamine pyrophosphate-binding protein [Candidatus Margulisiibacteriota bacterium]